MSTFYQRVSRLSTEKLRIFEEFSYSDFSSKSISFSIDFMSTFYQTVSHLSIEKFFNLQEIF